MEVDKETIDHIARKNYGGSMFWAINQPSLYTSEVTGDNVQTLAEYSQNKFSE